MWRIWFVISPREGIIWTLAFLAVLSFTIHFMIFTGDKNYGAHLGMGGASAAPVVEQVPPAT